MPRYLSNETVKRLALRALAAGGSVREWRDGKVTLAHVSWDIAGRCSAPVTVEVDSRPYVDHGPVVIGAGSGKRYSVTMETKCRHCENCLRDRAAHWRFRALSEWRAAPRTWLVTLTLSPNEHFRCLTRARRHIDAQGLDFEGLSAAEQFELRHRECGRLITLALKRLRKGSDGVRPSDFRYLLVAEAHKSGLPHYHLMVHEIAGKPSVTHAALKRSWSHGFLDAKLVLDERQATYATKYLSKSLWARVRASIGYGSLPSLTLGLDDRRAVK